MKTTFTFLFFSILWGFSLNMFAQGYTFPGGTGTSNDPYQIQSGEDLNHVREYLNNSEACFKLMNDIDLSEFLGEASWDPIGSDINNAFVGTFDGNNHIISNLVMLGGSNGLGFFGRLQSPGVVKNLIIENAEVSGGDWCGILVSTNGNWERNGGKIQNCRVLNSYLEGNNCLGAIAGVNEGTVEDCAGINNYIDGAGGTIGGLLGECSSNTPDSRVYNCFSSGTVIGGGGRVGGLIGLFRIEQSSKFEAALQNCATYGEVSGASAVGGIVAYQQGLTSTVIDNCFSACNVSGYQSGGIGGSPIDGKVKNSYSTGNIMALPGNEAWAGGITGTSYQLIESCYFSGTISGAGNLGGVSGRNWPSLVVNNCYYNIGGADKNMGEGNDETGFDAKGLTLDAMKSLTTMHFENAGKWQVQEGKTLPYFINQTAPVVIEQCNLSGASGTYTGNVSELFFISASLGGISDITITLDNGKWEARWSDMIPNDLVSVFAKEVDKMPSQLTSMRVNDATGMEKTPSGDTRVKVLTGNGYIKVCQLEPVKANYQLINNVGTPILFGHISEDKHEIHTSALDKGVYLLILKWDNKIESYKVVVM